MCEEDMRAEDAPPKTDTDTQAAPDDESTASEPDALSEVNEALLALRSLFEQKIARDQNQTKMFDAIYEEMTSYKEGFMLDSLHKPIIRRLIMLYDSFGILASQLERILDGSGMRPNGELSGFRNNLDNVRLELEEVLASIDVTRFEERLEVLDRKLHRTIGRQSTHDPEQDRKVAQVHKHGFNWQGKVFRPEEVTIFHYEPPATAAEEGVNTDE